MEQTNIRLIEFHAYGDSSKTDVNIYEDVHVNAYRNSDLATMLQRIWNGIFPSLGDWVSMDIPYSVYWITQTCRKSYNIRIAVLST